MSFRILIFSWLLITSSFAATGKFGSVYFSPDDQVEKRLMGMIDNEKKSIRVAIYTFTHRGIADSLIEAKKRGVNVEVIVDRFSVKIRSPLIKLVEAGIPVYVWDPDSARRKKAHRPLMHNKYCVFGDDVVWTGSFNFTYEASRMHQENVVVFQDPVLASAYKEQFTNIKLRSCIPLGSYVAGHPSIKKQRRF